MPIRATKRGAERTPLSRDADVLICGASFAGLAVARELAGAGARVLMIDRYEVGERQTSACAAPTEWLRNLGLMGSFRQEFGTLVINTPHATVDYRLPWTFSTFDYPELCALLQEQGDADFEIAKVDGRTGNTVHTDRGDLTAPLIVDALGWRRILGAGENIQPPDALLSRGLEVHPRGAGDRFQIWIDRSYVPAGYGWSFPARDEVRIGIGSFDPRFHVKDPTLKLTADLSQSPDGFQGNWIPHALRPATDDGVFMVGDSAGHCLPLTAEGIRTAFYFGLACGRELRDVVEGKQTREQALGRYHAFSAGHRFAFDSMLKVQRLIPRVPPKALAPALRAMGTKKFVDWSFGHYLKIAHPDYALGGPHGRSFAVAGAAPVRAAA
ncbi:NAD(P)/FAD-dependent oxidoreductase [Conexibacter arvalis]|uniref:Flavin-dependent dehydrogenase n=1 Tax=Conexibacter arvalis TaxID=912552 RepID=A0A840IIJ7_9ACTN|nr:FAD-dependent monooxygenase [Conexibacter arvalis]MBB4663993.1 flavin-dependent dehydrogenase [Conexibacter arvalis]